MVLTSDFEGDDIGESSVPRRMPFVRFDDETTFS
jgi:hypothetical protein